VDRFERRTPQRRATKRDARPGRGFRFYSWLMRLDAKVPTCEFTRRTREEPALTRSEIWRLEKYLRNLFRLDTITIVERPKQPDSVEVHIGGEFVGVLFKDEEDGEVSYAFNMAILEMDLPEPPASRT
jgi:hypothetical protein